MLSATQISATEKQIIDHPATLLAFLSVLVPIVTIFSVYTALTGRYLAAGLLCYEQICFLSILVSMKMDLGNTTRILFYRYILRIQIFSLGVYLLLAVGILFRLEASAWSFIFIFLLTYWMPNLYGGIASNLFVVLLLFLMAWFNPEQVRENNAFLIRYFAALVTFSLMTLASVLLRKSYLENLFQARKDLTRSAEEHRELNRQLKSEIAQRDRVEKRLHHAIKMETVGKVAAGVAHDLNNILAGIVTYPDLILLDMPKNHPLREPIETMKASGQKAAALVEDLLALSRRGVRASVAMDLRQIVGDYLNSPEFNLLQAAHPGVKVIPDITEDPMIIKGSPVHISKTLMNLVTNAAEAMPGDGLVRVALRGSHVETGEKLNVEIQGMETVPPGNYVVLSVKDSGTGIEAGALERIFEPFYTRKVMGRSGTGLGMALVLGTVNDHNGYIRVDSTPGSGTCICVYFPKADQELAEMEKEIDTTFLMGKGEKLLVIDDEPEQRAIAEALLRRLGYRVWCRASGEDGIAFLRQQSVDLVLMDIIMAPGMDGVTAAEHVMALCPGQRILFVTGFSEASLLERARQLGRGGCLFKPYILNTVGRMVKQRLREGA